MTCWTRSARTSGIATSGAGQEQIVAAVLGGRDVLAVMPTGSGKSLGYQLPAVMLPGHDARGVAADLADEGSGRRAESARHPRRAALHSMLPAGTPSRGAARGARRRRCGCSMSRPSGSRRTSSCGCSARCRSRDSSSTRRTASPSGVTTSVPTIAGCARPRRCCRSSDARGGAAADRGVHRDGDAGGARRHRRAARPRGAAGARRRDSIGRTSTCAWSAVADEEDKNDGPAAARARTPRARLCGDAEDRRSARRRVLQAAGLKPAAYHAGLKDERADARAGRVRRRVRCPSCARPTRSAWASIVPTSTRSSTTRFPDRVEAYYQEIGRAGRDGRPATATLLWDYGGRVDARSS